MVRTLTAMVCGVLLLGTQSLRAEEFPPPGELILIGDRQVHLYCQGEGAPTVVLDSGLGGTSLDWARVQPEVAHFTRVCSYDRAGYGWSDRSFPPRTSERVVDELYELLRASSLPPPYILVGHSFGGLNMRLYAHRYPTEVAGLVMVDATHELQFDRFNAANIKQVVPRSSQALRINNQSQVPDDLPEELKLVAQVLALHPNAIGTLYSELRHLQVSAKQVQSQSSIPDVPVIVIAHNSLKRARSARSRRMAELWMDLQQELASRTHYSKLIIAQRSGHFVHLQEPLLVSNAIREVLEVSRARLLGD